MITNDTACLSIPGDLEIAREKTGLTTALALQKAANAIVDALLNDASLPMKLADEPLKQRARRIIRSSGR